MTFVRDVVVRGKSAGSHRAVLSCGPWIVPCVIGRSGRRASKREGDGATPIGAWPIQRVFYRADRLGRPRSLLPISPLTPSDGWCDAPGDRNYNRFVRHPYAASAERLWREDGLYDLIVVLGHNDRPRRRGGGSAIFMHVARGPDAATEGCIALARPLLTRLLRCMRPGMRLRILP